MKPKKITALIPVYNEEECLETLYQRIKNCFEELPYQWEILFINDGSSDASLQIIKNLRCTDKRVAYLNLSRNYGKEIAMCAGFDYAQGDALVILDADLQDPPELLPQMLKYWEEGYDDVYGKRRSRDGESWLKKTTSSLFYKILKKISKVEIQQNTGDFRLLSRRAVEAMKQYRETRRYTKGFFSLIGFKKKAILFDRLPRAAGKSKWNYFSLINLAVEGFTSFSSFPLRISSYFGFFAAFIGLIFMAYTIIKTIAFGDPVAGYPTLISVILLIGGIQLMSIGVIGEYLSRVFDETKKRPLYFIDEYNDEKWSGDN